MNRKNIIKNSVLIIFAWLCSGLGMQLVAQNEAAISLQGSVVNQFGKPVEGALLSSGFGNTSVSAHDGAFSLVIGDNDVIISARGYLSRRIATSDLSENSEIQLVADPHHSTGMVDIAYYSLPKEAFPGSAVSVSGAELEKMPTNIFTETLPGRLLGLYTKHELSELTFFGYTNVSKWIRGRNSINGGNPIVIIDGIICPNQYWDFISPKEVESVTLLKDGATNTVFGIQGAAGAIVITTKRGYNGTKKVETYADFSVQEMLKPPLHVNALQYAEMRNQAGVNDGLGAFSQFSATDMDGFREGNSMLYPNNDWFDMFFKRTVMRERFGVNVIGGNDRVKYFSNIGYLHQGQPIKVADEPDRKYTPNPNVDIFNFRSNFDVKLTNYLNGFMRLTGNVKREMWAGGNENRTHYAWIFALPPTMYGPLTPIIEGDPDMSNQVVTTETSDAPPYGTINRSGYVQVLETNVIAQAGVNLDMSFLVKGLSANASMAYQTYARNYTYTVQSFERWMRTPQMDELDFTRKGSEENTPLSYGKGSVFFYHLNLIGQLNYNRRFGKHSINSMAYLFYQQQERESISNNADDLPYKRESMGVSATYGYADRYFLKGDIGYSGSEQFARDYRYIATPGISASWIVSKEDFLSGNPALSLLKLRASYGIAASDQLGGQRFLFVDNIDVWGNETLRGNPALSAEKIKMQNYGLDLGLFHAFTLSFDYFSNRTDNMLVGIGTSVPTYQGIPLSYYPKLNNGQMENKGFDIELRYNRQVSEDMAVFASAGFTQAKNKVIKVNEQPYANDYIYRYHTEGFPIGQIWGLQIDKSNGNGFFNSADELARSGLSYTNGTPRVGDFIYQDLNGDGEIDEKDYVPLGSPVIPNQYYSIQAGLNYKNFEVSLLFQGVNQTSFMLGGVGWAEYVYQGVFSDIHKNAWTPERYASGGNITFPALSLTQSTSHTSNDFFLQNGAYLRLKNAEIAYSLPAHISQKIGAQKIRLALTGLNLLNFDKLSTKHIDPEIRNLAVFQPYRVYNLGVNITF